VRTLCGWTLIVASVLAFGGCSRSSPVPSAVQPDVQTSAIKSKASLQVIAYLPDYRLPTLDPSLLDSVTDLIYFSIQPKPSGDLDLTHLSAVSVKRLRDLVNGRHIRLFVALGGWNLSTGFAPMAANKAARVHFVETLTQFCRDNGFDGADFDWEQPGTPTEQRAYSTLLTDVRHSFAALHLRLTVSLSPWHKLDDEALRAVDEVHMMAYDHDGQHATFPHAKDDLNIFVGKGVPRKKIFLGLPFYGRNIHDRNKTLTYADIVKQFHPAPNIDQVGDVYFNNINTIKQKTKYAKENGFGGVMVWELGQDTNDATSLIRAVHRAVVEIP